ncbi:MAG: GxxExxY protein [Bacteroidota bacterium]
MSREKLNQLSKKIIGAAIEVHQELGPGLLESVYEHCLEAELKARKIQVARQVQLPVVYKGEALKKDFFIDLLIEQEIIVELKCVDVVLPVHEVQLVTHLKLADKHLGLLLNFNVPMMKQGIIRKVNQF